ncbi:hypothetical protein [Sinimarinibacterium flocculans]|uniref:hypothetical protein n=1 Tax=Sinimarinibacterium flocculans TaxID=985250 RepID=UPI003512568A
MDVFTMVVLIVLIVSVGTAAQKYIKTRGQSERRSSAQDARIAKLEERVRALETVVTDHGFDLKRELRELERG